MSSLDQFPFYLVSLLPFGRDKTAVYLGRHAVRRTEEAQRGTPVAHHQRIFNDIFQFVRHTPVG